MKVSVKKPGSPEELVEHSGVKGMKWGERKAPQRVTPRQATKMGGQAARAKYRQERAAGKGHFQARESAKREKVAVAQQIHREARASNPNVQARREFRAKYPTGKEKATAIVDARNRQMVRAAKFHAEKDPAKKEALKKEFLSSPDRPISLRTTRGEKAIFGILGGANAALAVAALPAGPVAAYPAGFAGGMAIGGATRVAARRSIERKQARGGYG
jgi:hypothetical protein